MFDRAKFDAALAIIGETYEKTAPTVEAYADWLANANDSAITLADVALVQRLADEKTPPQFAANLVYHTNYYQGRSTVGNAGF